MTVERLDREAIRARAEKFSLLHYPMVANIEAEDALALLDATDALAGALDACTGPERCLRCGIEEWCSSCADALDLLDRLGYGAGEGEG